MCELRLTRATINTWTMASFYALRYLFDNVYSPSIFTFLQFAVLPKQVSDWIFAVGMAISDNGELWVSCSKHFSTSARLLLPILYLYLLSLAYQVIWKSCQTRQNQQQEEIKLQCWFELAWLLLSLRLITRERCIARDIGKLHLHYPCKGRNPLSSSLFY